MQFHENSFGDLTKCSETLPLESWELVNQNSPHQENIPIPDHWLHLLHKPQNEPVPYIGGVRTFLSQSGALWDICLMHCGIF